nr:hypothetical protein Iba_chr07bCG10580 [Ipomoea batatas]
MSDQISADLVSQRGYRSLTDVVFGFRVEELLCVANPRALSIERRQGEATGFVNPDLRICRVVLRQRRCCCRGHDGVSTSGGRPPAWLGVMSGVGGRRREAEGEMSTTCDGDDIWRRVVVLSADGSSERMAPKVARLPRCNELNGIGPKECLLYLSWWGTNRIKSDWAATGNTVTDVVVADQVTDVVVVEDNTTAAVDVANINANVFIGRKRTRKNIL